jgi:hypothetical protein
MARIGRDGCIMKGLALVGLVAVGVLMTGCGESSSSGPQKAAGVGGSLLKDKADMLKLKDLVAATAASLSDLITDPQRDLKPQYKAFTSSLAKLDSVAKKTRERGVAIQASLDKYLDSWREEVTTIQDETLRQQALDRVNQAKESFKRLYAELTAFKEALAPYIGNLKDVERYLNTDLTPAGLKTIAANANKAIAADKDIQARLDRAAAELARVSAELTAGQQKTAAAK